MHMSIWLWECQTGVMALPMRDGEPSGWCQMMTRMICFNILNDCKGQNMTYVDGVLLYFLEYVHTSSVKLVVLKDNLVSVPEAISKDWTLG